MKKFLYILFVFLSCGTYAQNENSKNLPPVKMLPEKPGEVKYIYELPEFCAYKIYDQEGKLFAEGNARFIDYTDYKKGTYVIVYNDKKDSFTKD